jgi:hypothetical protein
VVVQFLWKRRGLIFDLNIELTAFSIQKSNLLEDKSWELHKNGIFVANDKLFA